MAEDRDSIKLMDPVNVLIADASKFQHDTVTELIQEFYPRAVINLVYNLKDLDYQLTKKMYNLIILGLNFPDGNALDKIKELKTRLPFTTICIISGQPEIRIALDALQKGSDYYIVKDSNFKSDLMNVLNSFKNKYKSQVQLTAMLDQIFDMDKYPSVLMKASELGCSIIFKDFETFPEEVDDVDSFLENISISLLMSLGHEDTYLTGVFRFPAGKSKFFTLYDYAFRLHDPSAIDKRFSEGYFHYLLFVPNSFTSMLPSVDTLENLLVNVEEIFDDISQIDEVSLKTFKQVIFSRIKKYKLYGSF